MTGDVTLGLSLSMTGKYAAMGYQAAAALRAFVEDLNARGGLKIGGSSRRLVLDCFDDESRADRVRDIYRDLCFRRRRDLIFGPYSSSLARAAVEVADEAGLLLINHGGADDALHDHPNRMVISVLSHARDYLVGFIQLLATLKFWRKRLAIASSGTGFAEAIATGAEAAAAERKIWLHGVRLRMKFIGKYDPDHTPDLLARALRRNRINAFVSAGSYEHDLAMIRVAAAAELRIPVLGCIAAGVARFREDLGEMAEGIVGTSQWEPGLDVHPELGPTPREFARRVRSLVGSCDYPAAQIYAAGLLTTVAISAADSLDQERVRAALIDLRTCTLFGDFAVDRVTGRQIGHKMLLVQWHDGRKELIHPEFADQGTHLELPSAWHMLFPGNASARLLRPQSAPEDDN